VKQRKTPFFLANNKYSTRGKTDGRYFCSTKSFAYAVSLSRKLKCIVLAYSYFGFAESTPVRKRKEKKVFFLLLFAHLIVPLASPKVLSLDNKNKLRFILYCSRLFVPLQQ